MVDIDFSNLFPKKETGMSIVWSGVDIDNIIKTPPLKRGDTGKFHIPISIGEKKHIIILTSAQLLAGPKHFSTMFYDCFGKRVYIEKDDWDHLIEVLPEVAKAGDPEETAAVMAGHQLFEQIANNFEVTTDKTYIGKRGGCNRLVEHSPHGETWYVLPSAAVSELINELPIKASHEDISQAMTTCNLKKENTPPVNVGGKSIRCWWFSVDMLKEINPDIGVAK